MRNQILMRFIASVMLIAMCHGASLLAADRPISQRQNRPATRSQNVATGSLTSSRGIPRATTIQKSDIRQKAGKPRPQSPSNGPTRAVIQQVSSSTTVDDSTDSLHVPLFESVEVSPIDLATALSLVDVQNPEYLLAQQLVVEAVAERQLAAVQILPTLNLGTSYDGHTGNLLQSSGNVLQVKRNSLYVGAGASAIAAGTVNIPGVVWTLNVSEAIYDYWGSQQLVIQREHETVAARNELGLRVSMAYLDLLEAEAERAIAVKVRDEAFEVAKITDAYSKTGQGRHADAERAATELRSREADILDQEGAAFRASARLSQLLSFESNVRLHATDNWIVPHPIVPDPIPLEELLAIAILQRPELQAQQAAIQRALLALDSAKLLPFSPNMITGFSAGTFGGGSNLVTAPTGSTTFGRSEPRFGAFSGRTDFDVIAFWTLRNLGVGNRAMIDAARSRLRSTDLQQVVVFDQVRSQVAKAHTQVHARFAEIATAEQAVLAATDSWTEDLTRIRNKEGLPIEVLHSLRLLARSRLEYLQAIVEYNRAQFELYVALGQPPANVLVRQAGIETPPLENAP